MTGWTDVIPTWTCVPTLIQSNIIPLSISCQHHVGNHKIWFRNWAASCCLDSTHLYSDTQQTSHFLVFQSRPRLWTASAAQTWCRLRAVMWPWSASHPAPPSLRWSGGGRMPGRSPSTRTTPVSVSLTILKWGYNKSQIEEHGCLHISMPVGFLLSLNWGCWCFVNVEKHSLIIWPTTRKSKKLICWQNECQPHCPIID